MKWNRYRIKTTTEAVDMISYTLGEMGIEGVEIEDKIPITEEEKKAMFIDMLPDLGEDDGIAYVSFYIEPEKDHPELIADVQAALEQLREFLDPGELTFTRTETADLDWINNWKKFWKPFYVDDHILIRPSWEEAEEVPEGTMVISLDPGTAFGTGAHHTTKMCIHQLVKYLQKGASVFDIGCGSGILSIVAKKLGAGRLLAVDIDQEATEASAQNAARNDTSFEIRQGDILGDPAFVQSCGTGSFDFVVANIFSTIIIPLSEVLGREMKPGAIFICSGIIDSKEEAVREALAANGFEILESGHSEEWVSFTARKCT